jgi:hypothetical protein
MDWNKLGCYFWNGGPNLGDGPLNAFLLPKLFPRLSINHKTPEALLIGIGSILGHRCHMPEEQRNLPWIVYGAGYQYNDLDIPEGTQYFAVRGKKTAELCGCDCAMGDPAILLPTYLPRTVNSSPGKVETIWKWDNFIPWNITTRSDNLVHWLENVLWPSEKIVSDSLHAAIFADVYGIPWKPMRWEFKWEDHFSSVGINYAPTDFTLSDRTLLSQCQNQLEEAKKKLIASLH